MQPPQRGGFVVGLVIGLLIGLAVALAVALYVTKAPIPFINKVPLRSAEQDAAEAERNKNWDPNAPLAGKTPARPSPTASGAVAGAAASGSMTTVIEPPVPAVPASRPLAAASAQASRDTPARPAALPPAPGTVPARAAAPAGSAPVTAFYVQAGAYARPDDADAQRAKLALLGLSARITEREQAGRTVYRVRVGPFDTREQAEDAQLKLAAGGVEANLVRVER